MGPRNTTSKRKRTTNSSDNDIDSDKDKRRRSSVATEEEDDERLTNDGVHEVEEVDSDGNTTAQHAIPKKKQSRKGKGKESQTDQEELGMTVASEITAKGADLVLDEMRKRWTSSTYAFYEPEPKISHVDGRKVHIFKCARKGCGHTITRYLDKSDAQSTGNMKKHADKCWGKEAVDIAREMNLGDARKSVVEGLNRDGKITSMFKRKGGGKVTYSHTQHTKEETRTEIVRWVTESLRPFKIVSDEGFISLMKTGRPGYYIPSPSTVSRDVKMVFAKARKRIAEMLQNHDGDLNFATDAWTSPNHRAFVALTVHLLIGGEPVSLLLDLVEVANSHSGENLASVLASILDDFGVQEKILSLTCDNASSNDTMVAELVHLLPLFKGKKQRTRCFAHIVNLVAKSLLKQFDAPTSKSDGGVDPAILSAAEKELEELMQDLEVEEADAQQEYVGDDEEDTVEGDDELGDLDDGERATLIDDIRPVSIMLLKLRKLSYKILHSSTILLPSWRRVLVNLELDERIMPRDVRTRWNSTYDMLVFALEYHRAIKTICDENEVDLGAFTLSRAEWKMAEQLKEVLKVLKDATTFFSRDTPNLSMVIPAMDHIDSVFASAAINDKYSPSIRASVSLAKKTLNRYYSLTDESDAYRVAMVLHPRHKLAYFATAGWEDDWIKDAETLVRGIYSKNYETSDPSNNESHDDPANNDHGNIFDNLPALRAPKASELRGELDRFLASDPEHVENVIQWWIDHRISYPRLSKMALDYLTIPATSVAVERVFSMGRLALSSIRNRLSAQSTRAILCLGAWSRLDKKYPDLQLIRSTDLRSVAKLPEVDMADPHALVDDYLMDDGWDSIN